MYLTGALHIRSDSRFFPTWFYDVDRTCSASRLEATASPMRNVPSFILSLSLKSPRVIKCPSVAWLSFCVAHILTCEHFFVQPWMLRSFPKLARSATQSREWKLCILWAQTCNCAAVVPSQCINGDHFLLPCARHRWLKEERGAYQRPAGKVGLPFAACQEGGRRHSLANSQPMVQKAAWLVAQMKLRDQKSLVGQRFLRGFWITRKMWKWPEKTSLLLLQSISMCLLGSSGLWAGSTSASSPVEWDAQDLHPWRAGTLRWCYICNPWGCVAPVLTLLILCPQQMLVWRKELQKCRKEREREDLTSYLPFLSVVCSLLEKVVFSIISSLSNFFIILFIYLWLCRVFVAAWALSNCRSRGWLLCSCSAEASWCSGFPCCGARVQ